PVFGKRIAGFDGEEARITAVETRSSSPVRILRGEDYQSTVGGLYPAGEGAGYAGGITSAACDGLRVAESVVSRFAPPTVAKK
ncbi:MAG: NAD(FAD)-utilizing dehydrogenase, partial [Eubacterium sp.]